MPITCPGTVGIHGASSLNGLDIGYRIETAVNDVAKLIAPDSMGRRVLGLSSYSLSVPCSFLAPDPTSGGFSALPMTPAT